MEDLRHASAVAAAVPDPPPPSTPTAPARSTASDLYPTNDFFDPVMSGAGASEAVLGLQHACPVREHTPVNPRRDDTWVAAGRSQLTARSPSCLHVLKQQMIGMRTADDYDA